MRSALLFAPLIPALAVTGQAAPTCSAAALAAAPDRWDAASAVTGDLTRDGNEDVAFWKEEGGIVMVYIAACAGDRPIETWRFHIPLAADCAAAGATVELTSLLMDASLVERVCSSGETEECQHMRLENRRRQALTDAGARDLRIGGRGCKGTRLRWSPDGHGFMRIGG